MKSHHTAPTSFTELWTALANIWQVIPVKRFQKVVESVPRPVAAVIKARGGPTRYLVGIPNLVVSVKQGWAKAVAKTISLQPPRQSENPL
ncbi:transposable element Tcb2 transposase [Trichonephila clavipes]|nr:transposable element Tcb2 transposase [Trichonephila clavipes]